MKTKESPFTIDEALEFLDVSRNHKSINIYENIKNKFARLLCKLFLFVKL